MPPRLSTGSRRLVHVARYEEERHDEGDDRERERDEEDRSPLELGRASAPATSGPSAAIAPPSADQSAIDFVRPGPDHSAVIRASVVGYAIPAASPPPTRATKSTSSDGAKAASSDMGIASAVPRMSIILRP